ncbi:hypothetical protein DFH05DRAFT_1047407 [Lentinula detonsa]|uniref:Uncharacterized protein n=1 Tax=Lentinula detonsa TaxID=2804962 RepID=A0A9W8TZ36_9AGAR|nr:hypothetical protein DFH05DRAFT_1047407 [Lentinula detonsa]
MNSTNTGATDNTHYLQYDVTWASIVLLYYDWLLTIPEEKFVSALSVFGRAAIIATLIARTYAVCSQNRWIAVYLLGLGIVCVVTDAVR